ncbi:MAG: hypothetical protein V2I63_03640 [Pseudomonadales bacterium]|jgi:hypothetical protein|nr:hypothetical protein [Pseudomonadales bacterium]
MHPTSDVPKAADHSARTSAVCAWCGRVRVGAEGPWVQLSSQPPAGALRAALETHGICEHCRRSLLEELGLNPLGKNG